MKKIKLLLLKLKCYAYVHIRSFLRKRPASASGNILIAISGGAGDVLLDAQAFDVLISRYISNGKKVEIVSTPAVCSIMRIMPGMSEARFIPCEIFLSKFLEKKAQNSFKNTIELLRKTKYEHIILKLNRNNILLRYIVSSLSAKRISAVLYDSGTPVLKKRLTRWSLKHTTDDFLSFSDDLTQMQRSREFAMHFGAKAYRIGITHLPQLGEAPRGETPYITVTVDSSIPDRRWPVENFIELICKLLRSFEYDVVLTGSSVTKDISEQYCVAFGANDRVKNKIEKTDLCQWIELIRGAQFHIGVDSGSIHVAASVGTQAFCLTGVWDDHRFFPYQIEENTPGTVLPICVFRNDVDVDRLECKNCHPKRYYGYGNKRCWKECRRGKPNLCLSKITPDDVMTAINRALETGKLK